MTAEMAEFLLGLSNGYALASVEGMQRTECDLQLSLNCATLTHSEFRDPSTLASPRYGTQLLEGMCRKRTHPACMGGTAYERLP